MGVPGHRVNAPESSLAAAIGAEHDEAPDADTAVPSTVSTAGSVTHTVPCGVTPALVALVVLVAEAVTVAADIACNAVT